LVTLILDTVKPVTTELKTTFTGIGDVFVGSEADDDNVTVGGTESYVRERVLDAVFGFPALSVTAPAGTVTVTAPCPEAVTVME
jgi:hypothetical protein